MRSNILSLEGRRENRLLLGMCPSLGRLFTHRKEVQMEKGQRAFPCLGMGWGWRVGKPEGGTVNDHLY